MDKGSRLFDGFVETLGHSKHGFGRYLTNEFAGFLIDQTNYRTSRLAVHRERQLAIVPEQFGGVNCPDRPGQIGCSLKLRAGDRLYGGSLRHITNNVINFHRSSPRMPTSQRRLYRSSSISVIAMLFAVTFVVPSASLGQTAAAQASKAAPGTAVVKSPASADAQPTRQQIADVANTDAAKSSKTVPGTPSLKTTDSGLAQMTARQLMEASIARQAASIARQASSATGSFFTVPWSGPASVELPEPSCEPLVEASLAPLIAESAATHQIKPELVRAVIRQESGFRPCAVSSKGAMGLMQLMPATAQLFNVTDPFNNTENVRTGTKYLKQLLDRYKGNTRLALAAYNAGPGRVDGNPPAVPDLPETQKYVEQIMKEMENTK